VVDADEARGEGQVGHPDDACILDLSHDRLLEASYFLYRMTEDYHDPAPFRFNLNAFLNSLSSVGDMTRLDLEKAGHADWLKSNKHFLMDDPVLSKFRTGRNYVVHRGSLLRGSRIEAGIFRGRQLKLAAAVEVSHDNTTAHILERVLQPAWLGHLLDDNHAAIGEQLGVRRTYSIPDLSPDHDVVTACHLAWARASMFVDLAHEAFGMRGHSHDEEDVLAIDLVGRVNLLLEGDLDPDAYQRWGWSDE